MNKSNLSFLTTHIEDVIHQNAEKITVFAQQWYSFEEWLNLEMCVSLCKDATVEKGTVRNTPRYEDKKERMDISFHRQSEKYALELKIAHPGTFEMYKDACIKDLIKLSKARDHDRRIFILVVASTLTVKEFMADTEWNDWVNQIFIGRAVDKQALSLGVNHGSAHVFVCEISKTPILMLDRGAESREVRSFSCGL